MHAQFNYAPTDRVEFALKKNDTGDVSMILYFEGGLVQIEHPVPREAGLAARQVRDNLVQLGGDDVSPQFVETAAIIATCYKNLYANEGAPESRLHAACAATTALFSDNVALTQRLAQIEKRFKVEAAKFQ